MSISVSVGQFATMTHLSVKTLRHYHHVGLLEPVYATPRPATGTTHSTNSAPTTRRPP
jgi:MerR family regulatory protein